MLIVGLIIGVLLALFTDILYKKYPLSGMVEVTSVIALTFLAGSVIGMGCNAVTLSDAYGADERITIYQEENEKIEADIDILVDSFMDHEQKVMWAAEGGSPVALVNLYPDLKSDALVQKQIDIYVENNNKIKELRENKIDAARAKWWLYFGG